MSNIIDKNVIFEQVFVCPKCYGNLEFRGNCIACLECDQNYMVQNEVPLFTLNNELSDFENEESNFHTVIAEEADKAHGQETLRAKILHDNFLSPFTGFHPGSIILDIACGTGVDLIKMAEAGNFVIGLDISPGMVAVAKAKAKEKGVEDRVILAVASAYQLPFLASTFEGTYICAALHHMENPVEALREIKRVTKNNGLISIGSEPNAWIYKFRSIKHSRLGRKIMSVFRKDYTIGEQPPGDRHTPGWAYSDWQTLAKKCELTLVKVNPIWYLNGLASLLGMHHLPRGIEHILSSLDSGIGKIPFVRNYSFKWNVLLQNETSET